MLHRRTRLTHHRDRGRRCRRSHRAVAALRPDAAMERSGRRYRAGATRRAIRRCWSAAMTAPSSPSRMVGHDGHRGWVYYVASDPEHRYKGYGRAIMDAAEDWLRARGIEKLQLMVRPRQQQGSARSTNRSATTSRNASSLPNGSTAASRRPNQFRKARHDHFRPRPRQGMSASSPTTIIMLKNIDVRVPPRQWRMADAEPARPMTAAMPRPCCPTISRSAASCWCGSSAIRPMSTATTIS